MKNISKNELETLIKSRLSDKRYNHTLAVARLSMELAEHYSVSTNTVYTAAMLHDITKEEGNLWHLQMLQLQMLEKSDIMKSNITDRMCSSENIYHSETGFLYAKDILKLTDEDILNAIRYHTTGRANMSMPEKIIFTADTVAYDRTYDEAKSLRELAFLDINKCMLKICSFIISDLLKKSSVISIETIECYNWLLAG